MVCDFSLSLLHWIILKQKIYIYKYIRHYENSCFQCTKYCTFSFRMNIILKCSWPHWWQRDCIMPTYRSHSLSLSLNLIRTSPSVKKFVHSLAKGLVFFLFFFKVPLFSQKFFHHSNHSMLHKWIKLDRV